MSKGDQAKPRGVLFTQLSWFIRLRWVAGSAVVLGAWMDRRWFGWFPEHCLQIGIVGLIVLAYNVGLWAALRRLPPAKRGRRILLLFAWAQLLLDLACLTLLVVWTGGLYSPIATFFVFHMVFASLLMPRGMAYGGAMAALVLLGAGLWMTEQFPQDLRERLILGGRSATLMLTVYLANHITRDLRRQRRRLTRQNHKIRQITRQLRRQQESLIQHEKMVAMGQMAAGVTHEIANPLASMDSVLQLVQRKPERLNQETVVTLRQQVQRIQHIITQMKAFAHPAESQWQTLPVNEVVGRSIDLISFDKRVRQVPVERQFASDAGSIQMLPHAIEQVLVNLIINALDAVAEVEAPKVIVRTERREGCCLIEVGDNGTGIQPQQMPRIFEPFFTTKPVGKGTGLGLSISYSLMQKQGGSLTVRSHPGQGTTFTVRLYDKSESNSGDSTAGAPVIAADASSR